MLRFWLVLSCVCFSLLANSDPKKVIQDQRASPAFQEVYQAYEKSELQKKNLFKRFWKKIHDAVIPPPPSREYDVFTWWWMKQCVSNPSLDPTGVITRDLLTQAIGFGGWHEPTANPNGVKISKLKFYESAALLFYWYHHDMPKPNKGPIALLRLWKAAQDKQCLWVEPHLVDPSKWNEWIKNITPEGWDPAQKPLDEAINEKFECTDSLTFDKTLGEKWLTYYGAANDVRSWLGTKPYTTFFDTFKAMQEALKKDDMPLEAQREWLRKAFMLSKIMSASDVMLFLQKKDVSYLGCLNMVVSSQEEINPDDVENFRHFLNTFDPSKVDIEKHWKYIKWMNMTMFSAFHYKWQAICGDKEKKLDADGASNPIMIFKLLYDEEANRGLWPAAYENFPYIPVFLSITTHGDIDRESPVYRVALLRALKRGYDLHFVGGVQNFLLEYLKNINEGPEGVRPRYVAMKECRIGDRDIQVGDVLDVEAVEKLTHEHKGMFERQDVRVHPYNIWEDKNPDITCQRVSMAIDFLFVEGVWPEDYAMGLIQRQHKLGMMLMAYQHMRAQEAQ